MNTPVDILAQMGAIYSGRDINYWIRYQYKMGTDKKHIAIDFIRCYGSYGVEPHRSYKILPTADNPKSSKANGNRDGDYMLIRVGSRKGDGTGANSYKRGRLYGDMIFYV